MSKKGCDAMMSSSSQVIERDGTVLVFGLEWFPLIGGQPERQARVLARQQRAAYRVICAGGAVAVGVLRGKLDRRARSGASAFSAGRRQSAAWAVGRQRFPRRLCSAAAAFASLHPTGTVAALLELPGGRRWLVGVHEGAVMARTDHLHDAGFPIGDTIRLLREAHPGLVLLDETPGTSGLPGSLFQAALETGELLHCGRVLGATSGVMAALFCVAALGGVLAGPSLLGGSAGERQLPVEDPHAAWRKAIDAVARSQQVHGVTGLQAVLDTIQAVPLVLADWQLSQVECLPRGAQWNCRARYRRGAAADNAGFIATADPAWEVSFDPLEGAQAAWSHPMSVTSLLEAAPRRARENQARLVSALQRMLPAFLELRLEAPQPLPVSAPLDAEQRPIGRPPGVTGHQRRAVRVQAPLRSLVMLLPEAAHMSWERITLQVVDVEQPSLRSSRLRVSMSGVLYETEDVAHAADGSIAVGAPKRAGHDVSGNGVGPGHRS